MTALFTTDAALHEEADRLLSSGLREVLLSFGDVHVVGSYVLGLMVWRDLDLHVVCERVDVPAFFDLGARLATRLSPGRMHFRNELVMRTDGQPEGLYWGLYLGDPRERGWKVDIWVSTRQAFEATRRFESELRTSLTDQRRMTILEIETAVWQHPDYRRGFSSIDIDRAVIDSGVEDVEGFLAYVAERRSREP